MVMVRPDRVMVTVFRAPNITVVPETFALPVTAAWSGQGEADGGRDRRRGGGERGEQTPRSGHHDSFVVSDDVKIGVAHPRAAIGGGLPHVSGKRDGQRHACVASGRAATSTS